MSRWAFLWLVLLLAPAWAQEPVANTCTVEILSVTTAQGAADGRRPDAVPWQPVVLPDDWSRRWPSYSGTVWYRIDWQRACGDGAAVALTLESVVMAGEVFINDDLIWRDRQLTEPLSRSWNMPRYWRLPERLLHPGVNTLWVRVVGMAQQTPGLGPVYLGDAAAMAQLQSDLWWRHRSLFIINITVSGVMGGLFFLLWVVHRQQHAQGWYALMALFWVLFFGSMLSTDPWPFSSTLGFARASTMALTAYVACFCLFTWRFGGQSLPRAEKGLWLVSGAMVALMAFCPDHSLGTAQLVATLAAATLFFLNCLQFPVHALRTRRLEHGILAVCLLIFLAASAHDLLFLFKLWSETQLYTPITSVVGMLGMSGVLALRHGRNMRRIERFNQTLAEGIDSARVQLNVTLKREHALALANMRMQERLQIAHDLHDGLGGSLVRMMALVEQAHAPLGNPQVLSFLKLIRDDLRQTIDSGSSAGVQVPATPQHWIAPLRHRFMQLFDALGIASEWHFPAQWQVPPNARQCLALTRLVEESLVNVLKHSRARRVTFRLELPAPDRLLLCIEDDGVGFDVEAVKQAGLSVGMRSMHARIERLKGSLDVRSQPGRTVLSAELKLSLSSP